MYSATVRLLLNHLLRGRKRHPLLNLAEDEVENDSIDPAPLPDVMEECRRIRKAVDLLEPSVPKQMAVIKLVYLEGHTFEEAAQILGIVRGTAKSNGFKATARLRAFLPQPRGR
jgi:DNA-directed RNA polymerase specialized sigma24 family protein